MMIFISFSFQGKKSIPPIFVYLFLLVFSFQAKQRARPPAFAFCKLIQSQLFIVFWRYIYILMIIQSQVLEEAEMLKCGSCRLHSGFCLPFCAQLHGFSPFWFELGCAFFHQKERLGRWAYYSSVPEIFKSDTFQVS
uniref:Uncharacterized protein n=1 Tax=Manihot esculenta TaxID=3983 RepID=A0A2C9UW61_MANES